MVAIRRAAGADIREAIHKLETALPGNWWWSVDVHAHKTYAYARDPRNPAVVYAEAPDIAQAIERLAEKVEAL